MTLPRLVVACRPSFTHSRLGAGCPVPSGSTFFQPSTAIFLPSTQPGQRAMRCDAIRFVHPNVQYAAIEHPVSASAPLPSLGSVIPLRPTATDEPAQDSQGSASGQPKYLILRIFFGDRRAYNTLSDPAMKFFRKFNTLGMLLRSFAETGAARNRGLQENAEDRKKKCRRPSSSGRRETKSESRSKPIRGGRLRRDAPGSADPGALCIRGTHPIPDPTRLSRHGRPG